MIERKQDAQKRKAMIENFCKVNNYSGMDSVRTLQTIYYDQHLPLMVDYLSFVTLLRTDENQLSSNLFDWILGRNAGKKRKVNAKVVIIMIMNCIPNIPKLDKLIFSYNLFDEEDIRVITVDELKLIL